MTNGTTMRFVALAGALFLAGCLGGGGDGADTLSPEDVERVRSDPRIGTMRSIFRARRHPADPRRPSRVQRHRRRTGLAGEASNSRGTAPGTDCSLRGEDGTGTIALADLITEDVVIPTDIALTKLELGKRDGFDTLVVEGRDRISQKLSDETITAAGSTTSWGVWGKDGYAGVEVIAGSLEGGTFSSGMSGALAYVFGDRNPHQPRGRRERDLAGPGRSRLDPYLRALRGQGDAHHPGPRQAQDRRRDRGGRQRHQPARLEGHAPRAGELHGGDRGAGLPGRQLPRREARGGLRRPSTPGPMWGHSGPRGDDGACYPGGTNAG